MKFFTAIPMLKTLHYKRCISHFSLDHVVVGGLYDEDMQRKIYRFKFLHNHTDKAYFQALLGEIQKEFPYSPDIIVYPPISIRDRIFRGPNHAKILAKYLGTDRKILCPFRKKFYSSHQSLRKKQERMAVRSDLFFRKDFSSDIHGKKILLIDDLITTGYTAHTL